MREQTVVAEIDRDEVALIIAETCIGLRRPPGRSASSLLAEMEREQPKIVRDMKLAALLVLQHVQQKVAEGSAGRTALAREENGQ